MKEETQLASALADALGPLYRVSLVGPNGRVRKSFGAVLSERTRRNEVSLPGSQLSLRIDLDLISLEQASSAIQSLLVQPQGETPPGTFTHLDGALNELLALAEAEIGRAFADMSRPEKQRVVRLLNDRGAFALRKAVEQVADALKVSRFTVYNYLDAVREPKS